MTHRELQDLLGAFALDAVDEDERDAVEQHLRECPRCRAEVAEHREVAAFLGNAGAPAPDGLWERIAGSLDEAPPPLRLAPTSAPPRPARGRRVGLRTAAAAGAIAALAAASIAVLGVKLADARHDLHSIRGDALSRAAAAVATDPQTRRVSLRSSDGRLFVDAVVGPRGDGYLLRTNLPHLTPDRTYQLWAIVGTAKISEGVLGPTPQVAAFTATPHASAYAVTEESAGGVAQSSNQPIVVGLVGA